MTNHGLETTLAAVWRFLRLETEEADFEKWLHGNPELKTSLGDDLYAEVISTNFKRRGDIESLRKQLRRWAIGYQRTECLCNLLKDSDSRGLGYMADLFKAKMKRLACRTPWIELWRCRPCAQAWLLGTDTSWDVVLFQRVTDAEVSAVLNDDDWPKLVVDPKHIDHLWPSEGWLRVCEYEDLEDWRRRDGQPELGRLDRANLLSVNHRQDVEKSKVCGCYFCLSIFEPTHIYRWIDEAMGLGRTATCPKCGMAAVLGDASGVTIEESFLREMRGNWYPDKTDGVPPSKSTRHSARLEF